MKGEAQIIEVLAILLQDLQESSDQRWERLTIVLFELRLGRGRKDTASLERQTECVEEGVLEGGSTAGK